MVEKRPAADDANGPEHKRPKPADATSKSSIATEQIAALKARIAAAVQSKSVSSSGPPPGARGSPALASATATTSPAPNGQAKTMTSEQQAKIDAIKARIAGIQNQPGSAGGARGPAPPPPPPREDTSHMAKGGLGMALHPSLLGDGGKSTMAESKVEKKQRQQLDLSGPDMDEIKSNPYYDASLSSAVPRTRVPRQFVFNEKGKYIAQAAALRRQAALETMKARIAEQTRKAGLDEDRSENNFVVPAPPKVEWWDEGICDEYPDFDNEPFEAAVSKLKLGTDGVITEYIQLPVLLKPPQEKLLVVQKPLALTKKEQKKKRRQDRMEVLKEKQAKVRLGLEPPEPPKIKKSNLMRVLGEQAVKDPTAVEARVNREIEERREKHEMTNEERKLTKEQRREKLEANRERDVSRGIYVDVYRVNSLAFPKHRYKIDVNAKQNGLHGVIIYNPRCNLIIVEGGQHSIRAYRKLMLNRIDWTEIEHSKGGDDARSKDPTAKVDWLKPENEQGQLRDASGNRCALIWEGMERDKAFKTWSSKVCETDTEARRALERVKMENMWMLAKSYQMPDEAPERKPL